MKLFTVDIQKSPKAPGIVMDAEAPSLTPDKFYCIATEFEGGVRSTTSYDNMRKFLTTTPILVGHNIIQFDIPNLERVLNIQIKARLVDTLALSWYLYPEMPKHGLAIWGDVLGVAKPVIDDWENLSIEIYRTRSEEDVKINKLLWEKQWAHLLKIYGSEEAAWKLIDYLTFKMQCAQLQGECKWKLDREKCLTNLSTLGAMYNEKVALLTAAMPPVPIVSIKSRPAKPFKKDGTWSAIGERWFALLQEKSLPKDYTGTVEVQTGYEDPNPGSNDQIKNWLYSAGWVPQTFKYVIDEEASQWGKRKFRKIPQVRKDVGGEKLLCDSVLKLKDKIPAIEYLEGVTVLGHRISILSGFLRDVDDEGYLKAEIGGLANTLRFKHRTIVNLPRVTSPYGKLIRECLTCPDGYELCGSDLAGLEDRLKIHFIYPFDPKYCKKISQPGHDPHVELAILAKYITRGEGDAYKRGERPDLKGPRQRWKNVTYSSQYNVTPDGLNRNYGIPVSEGRVLLDAYWKMNWSIKEASKAMQVQTINGQQWLFNPVSKLWYTLRSDGDRFSTACQGLGSYCFDIWLKYVLQRRRQLNGQFHDEHITTIKLGHREQHSKLLLDALADANKELQLNRELEISIDYGTCYADIH